MDEMSTFDRQIAREVLLEAGPSESVDDLAVYDAVIAASGRSGWGFSMTSVLSFLAATAVVALFGSILLMGFLAEADPDRVTPAATTVSPSPMTTAELLSGMVTEEVEPGVRQVLNDGIRDITIRSVSWPDAGLSVDSAGDIWVVAGMGYPLGQPTTPRWIEGRELLEVTWDGTVWGRLEVSRIDSTLQSFEGGSWADRSDLPEKSWVVGIATTPEGTAWVTTVDSSQCPGDSSSPACRRALLLRIDEAGASTSLGWDGAEPGQLQGHPPVVSPDGDVWLLESGDPSVEEGSVGAFHRYDGTDWHTIDAPEGLTTAPQGESFGFGPDGTLWAAATAGQVDAGDRWQANHGLARLDDTGWRIFTEADGVQPWGGQGAWTASDHLRVAPDGSVWVNGAESWTDCGGVASFDGAAWTPYLPGYCVDDLDITHDGSVWVLASEDRDEPRGVYVITPGAVVAPS